MSINIYIHSYTYIRRGLRAKGWTQCYHVRLLVRVQICISTMYIYIGTYIHAYLCHHMYRRADGRTDNEARGQTTTQALAQALSCTHTHVHHRRIQISSTMCISRRVPYIDAERCKHAFLAVEYASMRTCISNDPDAVSEPAA